MSGVFLFQPRPKTDRMKTDRFVHTYLKYADFEPTDIQLSAAKMCIENCGFESLVGMELERFDLLNVRMLDVEFAHREFKDEIALADGNNMEPVYRVDYELFFVSGQQTQSWIESVILLETTLLSGFMSDGINMLILHGDTDAADLPMSIQR